MDNMTLDEAIAASDGDTAVTNNIFLIDSESRTINVPPNGSILGVETDNGVERKYFKCPRIVGDNIDLSKHKIYVSYIKASNATGTTFVGEPDSYYCDDMAVDDTGDYITFSWCLSGNVLKAQGYIAYKVVAKHTDGDYSKTRWNTRPAIGTVYLTVPDGEPIEYKYPDIVTQLLDRMDAVEEIATVEAMQGYVDDYLGRNPVQLDSTLTDPEKAAPADVVGELRGDLDDLENFVFDSKFDYGYEFCKWVRDAFIWKAGTGTGFNNSTLTVNVSKREISLVVNESLTSNATVQFGADTSVPIWDIEDHISVSFHATSTVNAQLQIAWWDEAGTGTTIGRNIIIGENDYEIPIPSNAKKIKISALRYLSKETGSILISGLSIVPFSLPKTHIMLSFDNAGSDMINDLRYAIVKGEYGWNFNFSVFTSISDGNKEAIKNGCDVGIYAIDGWPGNNDTVNSDSEEDIVLWENYVNNAIQALRNAGYYYPISWNCRQGVSGKNLEKVCADNSIGIVRGYYKGDTSRSNNLIENRSWLSKPFVTATASTVSTVKEKIDTAIANGYDICIVTHALYDDVETADTNYSLTPDTLREILDHIKTYVDSEKAIVCNFREYYKDINPDACYELDYKRTMGISKETKGDLDELYEYTFNISENNTLTGIPTTRVYNKKLCSDAESATYYMGQMYDVTNVKSVEITLTSQTYENIYTFIDANGDLIKYKRAESTTAQVINVDVPCNAVKMYCNTSHGNYADIVVKATIISSKHDALLDSLVATGYKRIYPDFKDGYAISMYRKEVSAEGWSYAIIDVKSGETYRVLAPNNYDYIAVGTISQNYIDYGYSFSNYYPTRGALTYNVYEVTIPDKHNFLYVNQSVDYPALVFKNTNVNEKNKYSSGALWTAMGDSLTDRRTLNENNYVEMISEEMSLMYVNKGVGGTGFLNNNSGYNDTFVERALNIPNTSDVVTIFGSFNDIPKITSGINIIGTVGAFEENSLAKALKDTIDNIISVCPNARIGIISPTPWAGYYDSNGGTTVQNYIACMESVARYYHIPYLDLYHNCGMRPWDTNFKSNWYKNSDGVHPTSEAHRRYIYPHVLQFMRAIIG